MPELQISLFGNFQLRYQSEPVVIPQGRLHYLLAYLTLHRHMPPSRQEVAFLFWPDSSEAQAHTNLRQLLHLLRSAWPAVAEVLQIDSKVLSWRAGGLVRCDVTDFEQRLAIAKEAGHTAPAVAARAALEEAVALYAADLLPSCYEEWLLSERERLRQCLIEALEQLVVLCESVRDYALAIHHAQRLLRTDPLHETTYRHLMRLQALNGDRASALRTYHVCTTILARELGVEPSQETQVAYAHLLQMEIPLAQTTVSGVRPTNRSHLVGRQPAWATMQAAWQLALRGGAQLVCIVGEAGIGKTRLAEELLDWARQQGISQAYARAYAAEGSLAYAPVSEWLRAEVFQACFRQLPDLWLSEVARLRPEILVERPQLPRPQALTESWQRQRFFEALAHTILAVGQPLLLVIDDLQWCGQETLEWYHYLLRFDAQARLLVVGTLRPEEMEEHHPLAHFLVELRTSDQLTEIELDPLTTAESAALAAQVAAHDLDSKMVETIYQTSEGNPLFLVEMVRALSGNPLGAWQTAHEDGTTPARPAYLPTLPLKVQAIIGRRLAQLSPVARELAGLAAVIGRSFIVQVLAQASGLPDDSYVRGLDELWRRRILREQGVDSYDFSHDRIREMAYAMLSSAQRRLYHRRVARALETIYGNALETVYGQLAVHYEQAGLAEQAIVYYRQAVTSAHQLSAYAEMATQLYKVLALLDTLPITPARLEQKADTLVLLADALAIVKGFTAPEVEKVYRQASDLCQAIGDDEKRFLALDGLQTYWGQRGNWLLADKLTEEMLALAEVMENPSCLRNAVTAAGSARFHQGYFQEAHSFFLRALALLTLQRSPPHPSDLAAVHNPGVVLFFELAITLWVLGYPDQAQVRIGEALALAQKLRRPFEQVLVVDFAFTLEWYMGRWQGVHARAREFIDLVAKYPFSHWEVEAIIYRGWLLVEGGEIEQGITLILQGLDIRRQSGIVMFAPEFLTFPIQAYIRAGQYAQGLAVIAEALDLADSTGEQYWSAEVYRLQGELLLASGAAAEKVEGCYLQAITIARRQHAKSLELRAALSLARLWKHQGRQTEAHRLLANIYGWFSEGFDTPDLQAAQALLADLSQDDLTHRTLG